jgi:nucleoside-diphosphate-sugar epimerase
MNVLVTGGAGFIGSHLVEHFHGRARVAFNDSKGRFAHGMVEKINTSGRMIRP